MRGDGTRLARVGAVALALAVLLSAVGSVAAIPQPDGTVGVAQSVDSQTVAPGGTVTVETTINATGYNAPAVSATLPAGWTVTGQSAEGPATYKPSTTEWVWLSGGEYTVTYTVSVPGDAQGEYTLASEGSAIDPADDEFVESGASTTVTVQAEPGNAAPTADAGSDQTVDEGATVQLDASGSSDPDGDALSYQWTQTAGPSVSLSDATTAQPTFTAPDVDGQQTMTFAVAVSDGEASDTDAVTVTVADAAAPPAADISVAQSVQSGATVAPGGDVALTATVDATGLNGPALGLTLPSDWTVASQSAEGPATYKPSTTEWVWLSGGAYTVTYTVSVPADATAGEYAIGADASGIDPATDEFVTDAATSSVTVADDGGAEPPTQAPSTDVVLSPTSGEVVVGNEVTYDVVVTSAQSGVGAYSVDLAVADPGVAAITAVSTHDSASDQTSSTSVAGDGSSASIDAALMDTADTGSVTVGTVTVEGVSAGSTAVTLDVSALGTETGQAYAVTGTGDAAVSVVEVGPLGDFDAPPSDTDGDDVVEDINGDGVVDVVDVQALYMHLNDEQVANNPAAFDANGDGTVDVVDVQMLFAEVVGGGQ